MFIKINGNNIYYEIIGEGIPVVAIHGFGVDHRVVKGFIERILPKGNYKKIFFDLPGMGKTETSKQLYKAEEMYDTIKCFIEKIIGDEKYIIIGESYGGYLMRKLIKDEPQKLLGALFVCPVIIPENEKRNVPKHEIIYNEISNKEIIESEIYKSFQDVATLSNMEILKYFTENIYSGIKSTDEEYLGIYSKEGYEFIENIDEINEPFKKPALFLMGKQDHFVGYKDTYKILENYPRASFCVLDEAGHCLEIEKIKIVEILTLDWLERIQRKEKK
jgi:pimeloyl-ACP methyl ester carboxylesterase